MYNLSGIDAYKLECPEETREETGRPQPTWAELTKLCSRYATVEGPVLKTIGYRGKRGLVTVEVHHGGLHRVYKAGELIGEYEHAIMAIDFARQQSGYGYPQEQGK